MSLLLLFRPRGFLDLCAKWGMREQILTRLALSEDGVTELTVHDRLLSRVDYTEECLT